MEHVENLVEGDNGSPVRSKRQMTAKSFGDDFIVYLVDDIEVPSMILKNSKASNSYLKDRGCRLEGVNRRFKIITV